jgi:hypothetical protein
MHLFLFLFLCAAGVVGVFIIVILIDDNVGQLNDSSLSFSKMIFYAASAVGQSCNEKYKKIKTF